MNCKNCKYWKSTKNRMGICSNKVVNELHKTLHPKKLDEWNTSFAELMTGDNFTCKQFKI